MKCSDNNVSPTANGTGHRVRIIMHSVYPTGVHQHNDRCSLYVRHAGY